MNSIKSIVSMIRTEAHEEAVERGAMTFTEELTQVINRHSQENASNTPDFILAQFLTTTLVAWNTATQQRETWYGDIIMESPMAREAAQGIQQAIERVQALDAKRKQRDAAGGHWPDTSEVVELARLAVTLAADVQRLTAERDSLQRDV